MLVEVVIWVAGVCSSAAECYAIPHPRDENKVVLEVCRDDLTEPYKGIFTTPDGRIEITTIFKPTEMCSSRNRPHDFLHDMQKP